MPKIIKGGVNYTQCLQADGITIIDSEGILSAVQQDIPQADGITIIDSEGILSAIQPEVFQPD